MRKRGKNSIGWCHRTINPITGCLHGCSYCYVPRVKGRFEKDPMKPTWHPGRLDRMYKELKNTESSRVFVGSCADMFGEWVKPFGNGGVRPVHVRAVLDICSSLPQHRFLFLTKNPAGYQRYAFPDNCWRGVSVTGVLTEDGDRIKEFLDIVDERRFVSIEPFIGDILPVRAFLAEWIIVGGLTGKNPKKANENFMYWLMELSKEWKVPLYIKDNAGYAETIKEFPEGLKVDE